MIDPENLAWIRRHMPLTRAQCDALPRLDGVRLACSIHLEPKGVLALEAILEHGAAVFLTTCNASTVRDEVVEWLAARGAVCPAWRGMSAADMVESERRALAWAPTHLFEMGASLSAAVFAGRADVQVAAAMECTGSGISRLAAFAAAGQVPRYPIFNCDDVPIKEGLHNRYLVGQSAWQAFTQCTQLSLHRKNVLVVGYGPVGQGVALTARALGGTVRVAEKDPARALSARYDGFPAGPLEELVPGADVIVTATGAPRVLGARHFDLLADGCILMNVGHTADEIETDALGSLRVSIPFVEEARRGGKTIYLFAGGSMANLTAGQGDTLNSFDITMAAMLAGLRFVFTDKARAEPPGLHPMPRAVWEDVARQAAG